MSLCPCGSGLDAEQCCSRYFAGADAPTCEALMRSRYTAYVAANHDYLRRTWHPQTCPESLGGTALKWLNLKIVNTDKGAAGDTTGEVTFVAAFFDGRKGRELHERSRFVRDDNGRWLYLDGDCSLSEIGRNDPCPCGSGRKFKACCGSIQANAAEADA